MNTNTVSSRYATRQEALSDSFMKVNRRLDDLNRKYNLADFTELNRARYPWARCLNHPEFYASRLWEYPWAILESKLEPGLRCADVGCGQTPFTIYLKEVMNCEVVGFDRVVDIAQSSYPGWGVCADFPARTGIEFKRSEMNTLDAPDASFDRVYCLSVIEHISDPNHKFEGMREMARILRPGGIAMITVDTNLKKRIADPLQLIWESGLSIHGVMDLTMSVERLGIFNDGKQPADVFGFALYKPNIEIETEYEDTASTIEAWRVCYLRDTYPPEHPPESPRDSLSESDPLSYQVRHDLRRNVKNGRPGIVTLGRVAAKFLARRYPDLK